MKVRTDAKRAAIVEAAAQLFEEVGYERASMNELSKRVGGSKGTLYGYFQSKEELFEVVVRTFATSHLAEAAHGMQVSNTGLPELTATLLGFADRTLRVLSDDARALACVRMVLAESGHSNVGELFHDAGPNEAISAVTRVLDEAMENGILAKKDPRVAAHQFLALVTAEVQARMYARKAPRLTRPAIRRLAERAVEMFLGGSLPR